MIAQLPIMGVLAPDVGPKLLQGARHVTSILWQVLTTISGQDQVLVGKVETAVARVAPGTIQDMESHLPQVCNLYQYFRQGTANVRFFMLLSVRIIF